MSPSTTCRVEWAGRPLDLEYVWLRPERHEAPLMVFLHEGLGSVSMWRQDPLALCDALGWRGLVYSRPGYGRSTPRAPDERWAPDFLARQAHEVLPALLTALGVSEPPWLLGHSDGGSIALLYAAAFPQAVAGLIVLAPHIRVEPISIQGIEEARRAYLHTDLKARLARHHQDPDSAFWGWNEVWLSPAFRSWDIAEDLRPITCPVLAVQGVNDEYGTLAQIEGLREVVPHTRLCVLPACGHAPHRDQPRALTEAVLAFVAEASDHLGEARRSASITR